MYKILKNLKVRLCDRYNSIERLFHTKTVSENILLMLLLSLLCVFLQSIAQLSSGGWGGLSYLSFPLIIFLNVMPIFLIMAAVFFITNRLWIGLSVSAAALDILLTVNYFKVYFRSETLSLHDFALFGEATNIMTGYSFPIPIQIIIVFLISVLAVIYTKRHAVTYTSPFKQRLLLLAATLLIFCLSYITVYRSDSFYQKLPSFGGEFNDVEISANKGFLYTFLSHAASYEYKKPEGYNENSITALAGEYPTLVSDEDKPVNVIAVMSEAFFDMEACKNVEFYEGMNPTPNLQRLRRSSLWGHILVPGYAGSTASTEFEFLTGLNISQISSAMPVVYKTHVTQNCYSLVRMLDDMGYDTVGIHLGNEWFYNRKAVYPRLGFNRSYFMNDFDYTRDDMVNYYISDKFTAEKIKEDYRTYLDSGKKNGYMSFTVTIQNHGPYKISEPETKRIKPMDGIDADGYNIISNYANGLHDADALLGEICDFVEDIDEPTVVVFFGDHLPYFDADGKYLTALGLDVSATTPESLENRYSTPYIIHGNRALRKITGGEQIHKEQLSSSFLGVEMMKYASIKMSPFFKAIADVEYTVSEMSHTFYIENSQHTTELSDEGKKKLLDYKYLAYWSLRDYQSFAKNSG